MTRAGMDRDEANAVWDVLVAEVGANERDRDSFVHYLVTPDSLSSWEYRFIGTLGFGGKLHWNGRTAPRVSCYPEDRTEGRDARIRVVNDMLTESWATSSRIRHE